MENTNTDHRQRAMVIGLIVLVVVSAIFLLWPRGNADTVTQATTPTQQVRNTTAEQSYWVSEQAGVAYTRTYSLTTDQINALQRAFVLFSQARQIPLSDITINTHTMLPLDPQSTNNVPTIDFDLRVKQTAHKGIILFTDLTNAQLIVNDSGGKNVYSSPLINGTTL